MGSQMWPCSDCPQSLNLCKNLVVDYAKMRHLRTLPVGVGFVTPNSLAVIWVTDTIGAIPYQASAIEFVLKNPGPPLCMAVNG